MNQRLALDMIEAQPDKGGMSSSALLLHRKQCEDFEKMQREISHIKEDIEELKANIKITDEKVDKILELLTTTTPVSSFFSKVLDIKYFWLWLIVVTGLIFGVNFENIISIFK